MQVTKGRSIQKDLEKQGIFVRAEGRRTLHEEVPEAYKDVDEVVKVVDAAGALSARGAVTPNRCGQGLGDTPILSRFENKGVNLMKIAKIEQFFPRHRMRLVRITTDNGLVGWGETTLEGKPKSTIAAVEELTDYLIGKDPLRIEHHWQHIYRSAFFRGGNVLMSALSGIDQALWDIAGKHYGVPTHQLLGGAVRDRIRVYAHWGIGSMTDEGKAAAKDRLEMLQKRGGYKAFKSGPGGTWRAHEPPAVIDVFVECAYLMREWVGPDAELCFDFHGKMTPALAIEVCHELKGMRPMFVEEPVPQENVDALKLVSDHVPFPIATGERLLSRWEFREVFEKQAVAYIQPDGVARWRNYGIEEDCEYGRGLLHPHHAALCDWTCGVFRLYAG